MGSMAEHTFDSELVEEFYNSCHSKADGRFCGSASKGKGVLRVPMSDAARRSNAILRRMASDRKSKEYKTAKQNMKGSWADREKGQGGTGRIKGKNSRAADLARAANSKKGAATKKVIKANTDKVKYKMDKDDPISAPSKSALALTQKYGGRAASAAPKQRLSATAEFLSRFTG